MARVVTTCVPCFARYCDGVHWRNWALVGPEKVAYYWDPANGNKLGSRDPMRAAFQEHAPAGWTIICIALEVQADGQ